MYLRTWEPKNWAYVPRVEKTLAFWRELFEVNFGVSTVYERIIDHDILRLEKNCGLLSSRLPIFLKCLIFQMRKQRQRA